MNLKTGMYLQLLNVKRKNEGEAGIHGSGGGVQERKACVIVLSVDDALLADMLK